MQWRQTEPTCLASLGHLQTIQRSFHCSRQRVRDSTARLAPCAATLRPNPSIERKCNGWLRHPLYAIHVERSAS